jgi:hypothetical protein
MDRSDRCRQAVRQGAGACEYWLRKAALLNRIALREGEDGIRGDAAEVATGAACRLIAFGSDGEVDYYGTPYWPEHPATVAEPRGYGRQEYAHWAKHH